MFHTRGWKWSIILLLAVGLTACLPVSMNGKLREDTLKELILAEPEPIEEEGLIFTNRVEQHGQTTCTVVCFNPDTLEETVISTFTFDSAEDSEEGYYFYGEGMTREAFSGDYSRMAVTECFEGTPECHAGWMDTEGNFFDVTKKLGIAAKGGYRGPGEFYALGFAGCWFGYYQHVPYLLSYMDFYVPVDMVEWGAVQESTLELVPSPGETPYEPWIVSFWLQSMRRKVTGAPEELPEDWDMVRSPDGTQKAYMSRPTPEGGSDREVYIEPVHGGEPVKLTGYSFSLGEDGFTLIDWR